MPQLSMLGQFSMAMARQIIAEVILVHAHAFLALSPEPSRDLALVVFFNHEVFVFLEVEARGEGDAALTFSNGFGRHSWVEGFEVGYEARELRSGDLLFGLFRRRIIGSCIFFVWRCRGGGVVRARLHGFIKAALRR